MLGPQQGRISRCNQCSITCVVIGGMLITWCRRGHNDYGVEFAYAGPDAEEPSLPLPLSVAIESGVDEVLKRWLCMCRSLANCFQRWPHHPLSGALARTPPPPPSSPGCSEPPRPLRVGIERDVGVAGLMERPVLLRRRLRLQERLHLLVDVLADSAHLGFGDAALHAQIRYQGIDLVGRDAADVGLQQYSIEGLIDAAAGL